MSQVIELHPSTTLPSGEVEVRKAAEQAARAHTPVVVGGIYSRQNLGRRLWATILGVEENAGGQNLRKGLLQDGRHYREPVLEGSAQMDLWTYHGSVLDLMERLEHLEERVCALEAAPSVAFGDIDDPSPSR